MVEEEMQAYYDDRSETWQEGGRGDSFQKRMDALCQAREELEEVDFGE
jgi:hypothetical protein